MGVGYRYVTLSQAYLLLRAADLPADRCAEYVHAMVSGGR